MKTQRTKSRILLRQVRRAFARQFEELQVATARARWLRRRCRLLEQTLAGANGERLAVLEASVARLRKGYLALATAKPHVTLPRLFYGYRLPDGRECFVVKVDRRDRSVGVRFNPCNGDHAPEATFGREAWQAWDHIIDGLIVPWDDE